MTQNEWDWNRLIMGHEWYRLGLKEFPSWQKTDKGIPHGVQLEHTNGQGKSSKDIAIEWDGLSTGCFYHRDLTKSNLPWVDDGEVYFSLFWFQFREDMVAFSEHFGDSEKLECISEGQDATTIRATRWAAQGLETCAEGQDAVAQS